MGAQDSPRASRSLDIDWPTVFRSAPLDFAERLADNLNALVIEDGKKVGRLLDWVGVAEMTPQSERVLILCAEYAARTGQMPFDEAFAKGREVLNG